MRLNYLIFFCLLPYSTIAQIDSIVKAHFMCLDGIESIVVTEDDSFAAGEPVHQYKLNPRTGPYWLVTHNSIQVLL